MKQWILQALVFLKVSMATIHMIQIIKWLELETTKNVKQSFYNIWIMIL